MATLDIQQTEADGKGAFRARSGGALAGELSYSRSGPALVIVNYTKVSDGFEGQGAGGHLVAAAVEWARATGTQIMPLCPFTRSVFERTPEYADVWFR